MKTFLLTFLLSLAFISSYSQICGKWRIIKYKSEGPSLSSAEVKQLYKEVIGKIIVVSASEIKYPRNTLKGRYENARSVKIIDRNFLPDSLRPLSKYFLQELVYFGAVTKQTINFLYPDYKSNSLRVYPFKCSDEEAIDCVYIYWFNKDVCGFCIAGDGLFLAEKIKDK